MKDLKCKRKKAAALPSDPNRETKWPNTDIDKFSVTNLANSFWRGTRELVEWKYTMNGLWFVMFILFNIIIIIDKKESKAKNVTNQLQPG